MIQKFFIPVIPKAQGRAKFFRRGNFVGAYDDPKSKQYKETFASVLIGMKPTIAERGTGVSLSLAFFLPRPKNHYGKNGLLPRYADMVHTSTPDLDNLIKAVKDAAKGILWHDDSQVYRIEALKVYSNGHAGTKIEME